MAYTNCLIDYIGLQGCGTVVPDSGMYVNGLPGISLKSVDNTADEEQISFAGVWSDVQERASRRLFTKIRAEFNKRFKIKNIVQAVNLTQNIDTTVTHAALARYRGFEIVLDDYDNSQGYVNSNFQQINVQYLQLYLSVASNTTIKIFDAITGIEVFSSSLTGVAGWNVVEVNEKYTTRKLFCAYNATAVIGTKLEVLSDYCSCEYNGCTSVIYGGESAITAAVLNSGITRSQDTFGLSGCYDVQCTYDSFVCCHKEVFANAYWYLLGAELLFELQYSPRINYYTTINAQKAKELRTEFDTISGNELMNAIDGINLNISDCCLECNEPVIIKENMP